MAKEILFKALRHEDVDRAPWVPFSGIHSGKFCDLTPYETLTDGDKLFKALMEVNKLYQPDGQPIIFDLQVEAEILGCDLMWSESAPPMVSSHPLEDDDDLPCACNMPTPEDGRLPMILDVTRRMKEAVGDTTALYGVVCGPFTLASHLRGPDIFMDMFDEPDYVLGLVDYCSKVCDKIATYYVEAGIDVIAYVDPLLSQISPAHFSEFASPSYTKLFKLLRERNVYSSLFVCGDATKNIEVMCKTQPDCISIDENINIAEAKKITDAHNVTIGGNIQLTITMLHGTQQDNMKAVVEIIDQCGTKNLIVSPGCDMPFDVPIANGIAAGQAVRNYEQTKEMLKDYEKNIDLDGIDVELPDYNNLEKPLVEVFTLDSASCAACGYMMSVANLSKEHFGDDIEMHEYKFTEKVNIVRCVKMGIKNLPALFINGELAYSSIIPSVEELNQKINDVK